MTDLTPNGISESIFVARQPVFTQKQDVWGYELLFRSSGEATAANVEDQDLATAKVIADGFAMAARGLKSGQRTLINFPQNLILQQFAFALPNDIAVIEILESVNPEPNVLKALQSLKDGGYTLALDDFIGEPKLIPFLKLADIVKVDILAILGTEGVKNADRLRKVMKTIRKFKGILLAEKVEDNEVFHLCTELGFTLFQGYFFSRPEIIPGKKISSNQISKLQLFKEMASPEFDVNQLSKIIQHDPSLSYRLFRYINSANMGVRQKVESVPRAITLLGERQLSKWLYVVILSDLAPSRKGQEVAFMSVHRGRFLELMSKATMDYGHPSDTMFLLGLFSLLDAMLGQPMEEILRGMPLEEDINKALLGEKNHLTACLDLARAMEQADLDTIYNLQEKQHFPIEVVASLYAEAMKWTQEIFGWTEGSHTPQK